MARGQAASSSRPENARSARGIVNSLPFPISHLFAQNQGEKQVQQQWQFCARGLWCGSNYPLVNGGYFLAHCLKLPDPFNPALPMRNTQPKSLKKLPNCFYCFKIKTCVC
jgi:hypothetical protein